MIIVQQVGEQYSMAQGSFDVVCTPCRVTDGIVTWNQTLEDGDEELELFFESPLRYQIKYIETYRKVGFDVSKLEQKKKELCL